MKRMKNIAITTIIVIEIIGAILWEIAIKMKVNNTRES